MHFHAVPGMEPGASCLLGEHPANQALPDQFFGVGTVSCPKNIGIDFLPETVSSTYYARKAGWTMCTPVSSTHYTRKAGWTCVYSWVIPHIILGR